MKKLFYLFAILCLPIIISAQEITNIRIPIENCKSRDSIIKKLLPFAEKWRQDYNSKGVNQLSPFYAENSEYISLNLDGYHGNDDFIAIFQKKMEIGGEIDSLLILSVNSSCDMAKLFIKHLEKVNRGNVANENLLVWGKNSGSWTIVPHMEAIKNY